MTSGKSTHAGSSKIGDGGATGNHVGEFVIGDATGAEVTGDAIGENVRGRVGFVVGAFVG
jgi:hypothetical protein